MAGASIVAGGEPPTVGQAALVGIPLLTGIVFLVLDRWFASNLAAPIRVVAFIAGVAAVLGGLFWVSYVETYGGGFNWMTESTGGQVRVYEVNEEAGTRTLVFTGTQAEVDAWMDEQRRAATDTTWPWVTVGVGGLVLAGSVVLGWRRTDGEPARGRPEHHVTA